jgi:hypothetical protein
LSFYVSLSSIFFLSSFRSLFLSVGITVFPSFGQYISFFHLFLSFSLPFSLVLTFSLSLQLCRTVSFIFFHSPTFICAFLSQKKDLAFKLSASDVCWRVKSLYLNAAAVALVQASPYSIFEFSSPNSSLLYFN